ncbi:hypothetical protein [Kitasatospora sp. GP82]|uniref:hypothetical protein n=1 Tax=Kitasatospora sp. GP82 TaxID=3035089 RepID=UPI0024765C51|nr:hypothetical protein [Kitasatospora sp. GP82]MDH6125877.1 hypothetical protein [Kitasatospora sp. GP82]
MAVSPPPPPTPPQGQGQGQGLGRTATGVAVGLVVVFVALLISGLEAIVLAGAGALFGTTVQRGAVADARNERAAAKSQAVAERSRADALQRDAQAGQALKAMVIEAADRQTGPAATAHDGRPGEPVPGGDQTLDTDLARLTTLARKLFHEG